MKKLLLFPFLFFTGFTFSQAPVITCWLQNTTDLGFAGELTNVQAVNYSDNYVYVLTEDIPSWIPIGYDWPSNPWFPTAMGYQFKINRNPTPNVGPETKTGNGHIGIWKNGCSIYNPKDAKSFATESTWYQNAWFWEHLLGETFDPCLGHPNGSGEYHTHVSPGCLYDISDSLNHSPLIGYAFDGYPIYGAYGYANGTSGTIKRMKSGYRLRNITDRTVLPDGTILAADLYGPIIDPNATTLDPGDQSPIGAPLGAYMEDYEWVSGLGDLDIHNGKNCITPEYPNGTYAYFTTIDWVNDVFGYSLKPVFPFVIGTSYYGEVNPTDGNTGPNSGFVVISEPVTTYVPPVDNAGMNENEENLVMDIFPNPTAGQLNFKLIGADFQKEYTGTIYNHKGQVMDAGIVLAGKTYSYDASKLSNGSYQFKVVTDKQTYSFKFVVSK
jgi:hypothetical protein